MFMKKLLYLLKEPFVWFVVLPVIGFFIWGGMNYSGFCWAEKRWLSDEERIDLAIAEVIKRKTAYLERGIGGAKEYELIPYASIEEFKQKNPDCCSIASYPGAVSSDWFDQWLGFQPSSVPMIWRKRSYIHEGKVYEYVYKRSDFEWLPFVPVNSCGQIQSLN
jgi:hypothetical protein